MKRSITILVILCLINAKCFSQRADSFPLKMVIEIDTIYSYPYKGLWFQKPFDFKSIFNNEKAYKIKATLKNSGKRNLYFYMMTCSVIDNLEIDNKLVEFLFWGCDSNYPVYHELKMGESYTFYVELIKRSDGDIQKDLVFKPFPGLTRLGLLLISSVYDRRFIRYDLERTRDKNKWKGIVWSNIINLPAI